MGMVDSQFRSSSNWARMLGIGDGEEEEEEAKALGLVPTCWGHHGAYSYPEANICTPKKIVLQKSRQLLAMAEVALFNISIASLNFASLSSPSFWANSCTFLISILGLIKDLALSALATVPDWSRRVLFLARLKDRKIFGLCFLCLSCDTHNSSGIFGSWRERRNLKFLQDSGACRCKVMVLPRHFI